MLNLLITIAFILSIAMTAGSIVISTQLKTIYKTNVFSSLIFFLAFYFTFGFYAIWGQFILESFLKTMASEQLLNRISDIAALLGSPFLIFSSLMFVRFTREMTGRRKNNSFVVVYLLINLLFIGGFGWISYTNRSVEVSSLARYYFLSISIFFTSLGGYYCLNPVRKKTVFRKKDLLRISFFLISLMVVQSIIWIISQTSMLLLLTYILLYFISGSFIPVYFKYAADLSALKPNTTLKLSFIEFCQQYGISPRESEIINEICLGLTNQQIADKLFISLQTVKDHTHRIYHKADCSSRAQLISLVNTYAR